MFLEPKRELNLPGLKSYRFIAVFALQVLIIIGSLLLAYSLRFDFKTPDDFYSRALTLLPAVLAIKLLVFWRMGLFKGWWRYVSMPDLVVLLKANVMASLGVLVYAVVVYGMIKIPRSSLVIDGALCFLMMGGVRFATRAFRENYFPMPYRNRLELSNVLIVGAGASGQSIAREIRANSNLKMTLAGFVDDDPKKHNQTFQGFPVLGSQKELVRICERKRISQVIIAIPSASSSELRSIVEKCKKAKVVSKTLPGVSSLIDGAVSLQHVRNVEVDDLLGRDPVCLNQRQISAYLHHKRILVTGAAGSIGSEICRQIAKFKPEKIILFDNSETPLFEIENELARNFPHIHLSAIVGDVRYRTRVETIFEEFMPEVVFHAAAYKHVPMMEANPAEAVNNNVRGTYIVAETANKVGVKNFVMISTDKAVRPTNIMGATKRAAELCVQSLAKRSKTRFVTVRFGNVLGSNGSVVPIFKQQIENGGPVTVTHPDVTRYFMTIPEASQLVLQAASMGQGGEIFLLDMGKPIKILDLAEEVIRLSGFVPHEDIQIIFTGLRPGEKLHEELLLVGEGVKKTTHEKICIATAENYDSENLSRQLDELFVSARAMQLRELIELLQRIVPEFTPQDKSASSNPETKAYPRGQIIHLPSRFGDAT